ncbi:MAG: AzlC family ABC transporter permease [Clostridia bacterium]|nr:AzlC family ABC transporter permease [Clostridia bacterium]
MHSCPPSAKGSRRALAAALPHTVPVMTGYLFLGFTYGIFMRTSGFPVWYPILTSLLVFAGSAEFVTVSLLSEAFHPLQAFGVILMLNARHLFYGISMLDRYRAIRGLQKFYMIFGLTDETFSVNCAADIPPDVDRGQFMFWVTLLDHSYWFTGVTLGALAGTVFPFPTEGLDFVMTAMFAVILLGQLEKKENRPAALLGLGVSLLCLLLFGADDFLLPAMLGILAALAAARKPLEAYTDRLTADKEVRS